jgi:starch synthase
LEGLLARRRDDLRGLLTGLDKTAWNPATDRFLPAAYHAGAPAGKTLCREALRRGLALDRATRAGALIAAELPLMAALGLGDPRELLPALRADTTLVLLGSVSPKEVEPWRALAGARPGSVVLLENFERGVLHRVLGGVDFFLGTASREPSPHHAQRALAYGAIPVMPRAGGPADVILDINAHPTAGTGILFEPDVEGWREGLARAQILHGHAEYRETVRERALAVDSSWEKLTPAYVQMYRDVI